MLKHSVPVERVEPAAAIVERVVQGVEPAVEAAASTMSPLCTLEANATFAARSAHHCWIGLFALSTFSFVAILTGSSSNSLIRYLRAVRTQTSSSVAAAQRVIKTRSTEEQKRASTYPYSNLSFVLRRNGYDLKAPFSRSSSLSKMARALPKQTHQRHVSTGNAA